MNPKRIGEPLRLRAEEDQARERVLSPREEWVMSQETREAIERIEDNIRAAEQRKVAIFVG